MTATARWTVALTSAAAALVGAGFGAAWSQTEANDAYRRGIKSLPLLAEWLSTYALFSVAIGCAFLAVNVTAAARRSDTATIVGASLAWLFAFAWVLFCIWAWRVPYILIGQRLED